MSTRSWVSARSVSTASSPATPPPAMTTVVRPRPFTVPSASVASGDRSCDGGSGSASVENPAHSPVRKPRSSSVRARMQRDDRRRRVRPVMHARAVEEAAARLHDLRHAEWEGLGVGALALGLAVAATQVHPPLALPLFLGGLVVGGVVCEPCGVGGTFSRVSPPSGTATTFPRLWRSRHGRRRSRGGTIGPCSSATRSRSRDRSSRRASAVRRTSYERSWSSSRIASWNSIPPAPSPVRGW